MPRPRHDRPAHYRLPAPLGRQQKDVSRVVGVPGSAHGDLPRRLNGDKRVPDQDIGICGEHHRNGAACQLASGHGGEHWGHAPCISWSSGLPEVELLRRERDGLQRRIDALTKDAAIRTRTIRRLEKELLKKQTGIVGECHTCDGLIRHVPYCSHCGPHPWYGPCDGLGRSGECSECVRITEALRDAPPAADAVDPQVTK